MVPPASPSAALIARAVGVLPEGFLLLDAGGRISMCNAAAIAILGLASTPAHLDDLPEVRGAIGGDVPRAPFSGIEVAWHRPDTGEPRVVEIGGAPIEDGEGGVTAAAITVRDVTEARRERDRLCERGDDLARLMEIAPIPIFVAEGPRAERISGNPAASAAVRMPHGSNLSASAPAREIPLLRVLIEGHAATPEELPMQRAAIHGVEVMGIETRHVYDDGTVVDYYGSAVPLFDARGAVRGAVGSFIDISERKRLETALRESHRIAERRLTELTTIYASAPIGLCVFDPHLRIVHINDQLAASTRFPVADLLGKTLREVLPSIAGDVEPILREVLATGVPRSDVVISDHKGVHGDREQHWIASYFPLKTAEGEVTGVNAAVLDVTAQKQLEAERDFLLGAERAARAEAERANRTKDDFLATLSHELRTPLNAILGWAQMLRSGKVKPESVPRALEVIERNAHLQAQLVCDLLDMSRIAAGKVHLDLRPVALPTVIDVAIDAFRSAAEAKKIALSAAIDPRGAPVRGDAARIQQVLSNLLSNAIKFTPAGGRVHVSLERHDGVAEIMVRDTGKGIPPAFLPHVFDRFAQADTGAAREHGGLGLGLNIVRSLVELHGGRVRAESEGAGLGATFVVELPLADEAPDSVTSRLPAAGEPLSLHGARILVVDDEPDARELLQRILEERGAHVAAAASAKLALEALAVESPDVIVSDVGMPGMDGYALLRAIRAGAVAHGQDVPAVAVTAFARPEDAQNARNAGFQVHLAKPLDPGEIVATVARLRTRRAAGY